MLKSVLLSVFFITTLFGEVINQYPSQALIDSKIKIIDIRTFQEWKETGLLEGAIPLTFFDINGKYNIPLFMRTLHTYVKEGEKFALICHVGSRTAMLAEFLDTEYKMPVINLLGGMEYAKKAGLKFTPYVGRR